MLSRCQSGVAVTGDVGGDRFQAEAVADGFGHVGLVLDDQHTHTAAMVRAGTISSAYRNPHTCWQHQAVLTWRRDRQPTSTNRSPLHPVAGVLVFDGGIRSPGCAGRGMQHRPRNGNHHLWLRAGRGRPVPRDGASLWRCADRHRCSGVSTANLDLASGNRCISVGHQHSHHEFHPSRRFAKPA